MRGFLASALVVLVACVVGAAPPPASADPTVTSATGQVKELRCQAGALVFAPPQHLTKVDKAGPASTNVTTYDEHAEAHATDPGGPSVTGEGNINQPNIVIGPLTSDSSVRQTTTVSASAESVVVESAASGTVEKTRVPSNCCFGALGAAFTQFDLDIVTTRRCSYRLSGSLSAAADDPNSAGLFVSFLLLGNEGDTSGLSVTASASEQPSVPLARSGFFDAGPISLRVKIFCDLGSIDASGHGPSFGGSQGRASWTVSFSLSPEEPSSDIRWTKPTGGPFGTGANWNPPQVPLKDTTHTDVAIFDLPRNYTVDAGGARKSDRLVILRGTVTFANTDYKVDNPSLDRPSLVVDVGKLLLVSGTLTSNSATIGDAHSLGAEIEVDGPNARWDCLGRLSVGGSGGSIADGKLTISGGADVASVDTRIGAGGGQRGLATVTGSGSTWSTDNVHVGFTSPGQLDILDGGGVTSAVALVGAGFSSGGADTSGVRIAGVASDGTSSEWNTTVLSFGQDSFSAVSDGGRLNSADLGVFGGGALYVVGLDAARNRASLVACNDLRVGTDGFVGIGLGGALDVVAGDALLGAGGSGSVTVDGVDAASGLASTFHVDGQLQVGQTQGAGLLQIYGGAAVTCGSDSYVGTEAHTVGVVLVDGAASSWKVTGDLYVGDVLADAPGSSGTILLNGSLVSATDDIRVEETGTVLGNGTLVALGTMYVNGFIGPGVVQGIPLVPLSPPKRPVAPRAKPKTPPSGTLTIQGNLVVGPTGVIRAEAAGAQSDRLVVTGSATLDGTLVLQFKNGFAPKTGDEFELLHVDGAVTGSFASVETRGLAPGAQFDVSTAGGALKATAMNDTVALPTVSVKASAKKLLEKQAKKKKATLTFTRTGPATAPLIVSYTLRGSASNGFDYVSLPGVVTIPAKKKSVKVTVQLVADVLREVTETIDVAVVPGADYTESLASSARIALIDNN